jgi:ABC-type multidrug transport system fused ATPase/permease subunit
MLEKISYIFTFKQKLQLGLMTVLGILNSVLELLGLSAILPVCTALINPGVLSDNKYYIYFKTLLNIKTINDFIVFACISLTAVYIIKNVVLIAIMNYKLKLTYELREYTSNRLMESYMKQNYLFHTNHNAADLQRNISTDVTLFFQVVAAYIDMFIDVLTGGLIVSFLFLADPITSAILIGGMSIILFAIMIVYRKMQTDAGAKARHAAGLLNKWILQSFNGIKEIKANNRESFFLDNYRKALKDGFYQNLKYNKLTGMPKYIIEMACMSGVALTIAFRVLLGVDVEQFAITLSAFAVAMIKVLPIFNHMVGYVSTISFGRTATINIYNDLYEIDQELGVVEETIEDESRFPIRDCLSVNRVSFCYPNSTIPVFTDANLVVKKNTSVALIGSSGAGKTTLADIMLGLLSPQKGSVTVDGKDISKYMNGWHQSIGYIPQFIYLMDDTIRNNIVFGAKAPVKDDYIWSVLEKVQLAEFVRNLEKGLDTEIGDRGVRLSGGQRQRLGIARALYMEPAVLFLDEATSALDNDTEAAVMEAINSLHGEITLVIIAHRLSTIKKCDYVYRVGDGKIEACTLSNDN